jgi:malonyl-CoA O-methyltransferase
MRGLARRLAGRPPPVLRVGGDWRAIPLPGETADLVASNLALHWDSDPAAWCAEVARVLRPGGLVAVTILGASTLVELADAWAAVGERGRVNALPDLHDVGDALTRAGLADVVVDAERLSITYDDPRALLGDLRGFEPGNVERGRPRGLTTARRLEAMLAAYRADPGARETGTGRCLATVELVFVHAWRAAPRASRPRSVEVSLSPPPGRR